MIDSVTVLFGSTVVSVQATATRSRKAGATRHAFNVLFMSLSLRRFESVVTVSELDAQPTGDGARAWIDVVVDAVQACRRVDALVARDGERVLHGAVQPHRLATIQEGVPECDVVH